MTNVPEPVREMWTDMYKLFDQYYLMENDYHEWKRFWDAVEMLYLKHGKNVRIREMAVVVSGIIEDRMKAEGKT